jgi:hypothetical protein
MLSKKPRRFASPGKLTDSSEVLGVSVAAWDQAFRGNLDKSLLDVQKRVSAVAAVKKSAASLARRNKGIDLTPKSVISTVRKKVVGSTSRNAAFAAFLFFYDRHRTTNSCHRFLWA